MDLEVCTSFESLAVPLSAQRMHTSHAEDSKYSEQSNIACNSTSVGVLVEWWRDIQQPIDFPGLLVRFS